MLGTPLVKTEDGREEGKREEKEKGGKEGEREERREEEKRGKRGREEGEGGSSPALLFVSQSQEASCLALANFACTL